MSTKLYLDIDGVLLSVKGKNIPEGAEQFITWAVANFDCFWLTTHCRGGENKAVQYLQGFYPKHIVRLLESVKATDWYDKKTEAIDNQSPFIWVEDYPFQAELDDLKLWGKLPALVKVDLSTPNALHQTMTRINEVLPLLH